MDFWDAHGVIFLICMFFFPRITMLVATPLGGCLWWLGWVFTPYLLAAILATTTYWDTNPVLCVFAWLVAVGGTQWETKQVNNVRKTVVQPKVR